MKRILSLFLCIVMLALVLVSCGDDAHVHTYNRSEWKSDATNHWYAATCGCKDAGTKNLSKHVDSMNDGICDICEYKMCNNEAYETEYSFNETAHWLAPTCGHEGHISKKDTYAAHNCDETGACTVCDYVCTNTAYGEEYGNDENNHWQLPACGHIGHMTVNPVPHENNDDDSLCDSCGYKMCEGEYATEYSSDEEGHWFAPTCGHVDHEPKDFAAHEDTDSNLECDACGAAIIPVEPAE